MTALDPAWVEAGAKALAAEGVSERSTGGLAEDGLAWVVVHAVAPLIREQIAAQIEADLRAKVEGLPYRTWVPPHATDCPGRPGKRGICTCGDSLRASDWMLRADVFALLNEEAQS